MGPSGEGRCYRSSFSISGAPGRSPFVLYIIAGLGEKRLTAQVSTGDACPSAAERRASDGVSSYYNVTSPETRFLALATQSTSVAGPICQPEQPQDGRKRVSFKLFCQDNVVVLVPAEHFRAPDHKAPTAGDEKGTVGDGGKE